MNSNEKNLINAIEAAVPTSVKVIRSIIEQPYCSTVNVGELFERVLSGYCNEKGFSNECEGKKGSVVDLYFHNPGTLVQVKTTAPFTKNPKSSFQFCRTDASYTDEAIQAVRGKFFKSFTDYVANEFYLVHHDFRISHTALYHLATKKDRVKFHGRFLNGDNGSMSKDYLMVPKSNLLKVWEKQW